MTATPITAPDSLTITQEHIDVGWERVSFGGTRICYCPIALAAQARWGDDVLVGTTHIYKAQGANIAKLSPEARDWQHRFDNAWHSTGCPPPATLAIYPPDPQ